MSGRDSLQHPCRSKSTFCAVAVLSTIACDPVLAQPKAYAGEQLVLEEVIVTARKRQQALSDVPEAVSVLSTEVLEQPQFVDLASVADRVPSMTVTSQFANSNIVSLRGLVPTNFRSSSSPLVATYIDDLPISEITTPDIALYDLQRIEVLRGPQGTLYGENSMGGTIKYITNAPVIGEFGGSLDSQVSTTEDGGENYELNGVINVPLTDSTALRLVGIYRNDGGFIDNPNLDAKDVDDYERWGTRGSLLFSPTERFSAYLTGFYQEYDGADRYVVHQEEIAGVTPPLATVFGDAVTYKDVEENLVDEVRVTSLSLSYDVGPGTLTSASSYYKREEERIRDERATTTVALDPLALGIFGVYVDGPTLLQQDREVEVFSQELRYSFEQKRLLGTVGVYYRNREEIRVTDTRNPAFGSLFSLLVPGYSGFLQDSDEDAEFEQYAAFAQLTYSITDTLRITGGLRYYNETVSGSSVLNQIDPTLTVITFTLDQTELEEDDVLYKFGLEYDVDLQTLVYANFGQGFRPGGYNSRRNPFLPPSVAPPTYDADYVDAVDLGVKTAFFDGKITANIAGFYTWYDDAQVVRTDNPPFSTTINAGSATSYGIEAEVLGNLGAGFTVGGSLSLMKAEFTEDAVPDPGTGFVVLDGQSIPGTREESFSVFAEYRRPAFNNEYELFVTGDWSYASSTTASIERKGEPFFLKLDSYTLVNTAVGIENSRWSASVFVNNLTDEFVGFGGNLYDGIVRGRPRVYGLQLGLEF